MSIDECSRESALTRSNPNKLLQMGLTLSFLTATSAGFYQLLKPVGVSIAPFTSNIHAIGIILLSGPALLYMIFSSVFSQKTVDTQTSKTDLEADRQVKVTDKNNSKKTDYQVWGSE